MFFQAFSNHCHMLVAIFILRFMLLSVGLLNIQLFFSIPMGSSETLIQGNNKLNLHII